MNLSSSTRRALRTWFHGLIGVLTALPTILPLAIAMTHGLPSGDKLAAFGGLLMTWTAIVSKVINRLEDAGIVPAWLKGSTPALPDAVPTSTVAAGSTSITEGDAAP